ncbi:hypothetical protein MUN81_10280 [Hymenobacter sp. 5317J-9]|uniref:hypothetical protein n=1 Tax=Hymenobacter sp. 5317J-9 TaxID=2932250 RepID=UPI001FD6BE30|nr:hypothetical protein [Hymenobacter sp. 5317J-9]UOQ99865.1 hypothetical protein MUN81_10280 [Hymenobacter sp. 5317J-9]
MAKKNTTAQPTVAAQVESPEVAQDTEVAAEATAAEATTEEAATEEKAKRERGYSQSAINKEDLDRLNAFKTNIKETRKLNVSNQVILAAALDCLATTENMEAFLKKLVAAAADKQRAKDLKAFEALRAKLESTAEPVADATSAPEEATEGAK